MKLNIFLLAILLVHVGLFGAASSSSSGVPGAAEACALSEAWRNVRTMHHPDLTSPQLILTHDERKLVSFGMLKNIRVWDIGTGDQLQELCYDTPDLPHKILQSVVVTQDDSKVVSGGEDGIIRVWDINSGKMHVRKELDTRVTCVAVTHDSKKIISLGEDPAVNVLDITTGDVLGQIKPFSLCDSVMVTRDDSKVILGAWDNILLFDIETGEELFSVEHRGILRLIALLSDGKVVTTCNAGKIDVWEMNTGEQYVEFQSRIGYRPLTVAIAPDESKLVAGFADGSVSIGNLKIGKNYIQKMHDAEVASVAFMGDGDKVASTSRDGTICIWDAGTLKLLAEKKHDRRIHSVVVTKDAGRIMYVLSKACYGLDIADLCKPSSEDGKIYVWQRALSLLKNMHAKQAKEQEDVLE